MSDYPAYIQRMLVEAREQGQWYCGQYDAAARCFDILALFPDYQEAASLAYELFCDEWWRCWLNIARASTIRMPTVCWQKYAGGATTPTACPGCRRPAMAHATAE